MKLRTAWNASWYSSSTLWEQELQACTTYFRVVLGPAPGAQCMPGKLCTNVLLVYLQLLHPDNVFYRWRLQSSPTEATTSQGQCSVEEKALSPIMNWICWWELQTWQTVISLVIMIFDPLLLSSSSGSREFLSMELFQNFYTLVNRPNNYIFLCTF